MFVCVYVDIHEHRCLLENQKMGWNLLGARVTANCESSDMNIGSSAPNLYKSSVFSQQLNYLFSPTVTIFFTFKPCVYTKCQKSKVLDQA